MVVFNPELHYFGGRPCQRGHGFEPMRYIESKGCVVCANDRSLERRLARPRGEMFGPLLPKSERYKLWAAANVGKIKEKQKEYYAQNRERLIARTAAWSEANPAAVLARVTAWAAANPEKARANKKRWSALNPECGRAAVRNRRARLGGAEGSHSASDVMAIFATQKGRCAACKQKRKLTVDHYYPIARGGTNFARNIQGLCGPCNSSKRDRHPIEFMQSRGMLL